MSRFIVDLTKDELLFSIKKAHDMDLSLGQYLEFLVLQDMSVNGYEVSQKIENLTQYQSVLENKIKSGELVNIELDTMTEDEILKVGLAANSLNMTFNQFVEHAIKRVVESKETVSGE